MGGQTGLEPARISATEPQSVAATNFATAHIDIFGAQGEIRTHKTLLLRQPSLPDLTTQANIKMNFIL